MQFVNGLSGTMRAVSGTTRTEAKNQALSWLATQLSWENTLEALREDEDDAAAKAA